MSVDLEAIRRKVQELNGQRRNSSVQLWKPEAGTYRIRGLPWKNLTDGTPFIERQFYYIGDERAFLAPEQFGQPDPIAELRKKMFSSKDPDDREVAKKLFAKMKAYMAIVVRGQEDKGVLVWAFNKFIYQRLLGFFTDEDGGDFLDPLSGFDLKVTLTKSGKKFGGREMYDTVVDMGRPSPLSDNPDTAQAWLNGVPSLDDMYKPKTTAEIEQVLNNWLSAGSGEGTAKGPDLKDELDTLVADVKGEAAPSKPKAAEAKKADKPLKKAEPVKEEDADLEPAKKGSIDDAFAELMDD